MTKKDIFIQIIAETSGKSDWLSAHMAIEYVTELTDLIDKKINANWHDELPDKEANELLEGLRKEKPGIAWCPICSRFHAQQRGLRASE